MLGNLEQIIGPLLPLLRMMTLVSDLSFLLKLIQKNIRVVRRGVSPRETEQIRRRQKVRASVKEKQRMMPASHTSKEGRKPDSLL